MAETMAVDVTSVPQQVETDPETANTGISQDMSKPTKSKVSTSQLVSKKDLFMCFRQKTSDTTKPIALMSRYNSETPLKDLVDSKELYSRSLLQLAGIRGWRDVCEILIDDHHCDPFYEDDNKWTVLHNVCRNGHIDLVCYFVSTFKMEHLIHKKNKDGTTPLQFSIERRHTDITKYLESIMIKNVSGDAKKHHDEEENDNNMDTRMSSNTSSAEGCVITRKRKNENSEDNGTTGKRIAGGNILRPSDQPDYTLVDNKNLSGNNDFLDVIDATASITDWSVLSLKFGITKAEYSRIKQKVIQDGNLQMEIISRWFHIGNASWSSLVQYLHEICQYDVAQEIAKAHPC